MKRIRRERVIIAFMILFLFNGVLSAQDIIKRNIDFDIDQDGMTIKGTVNVAVQFIFFGYPYLKASYADLVIEEFIYDNEVYNANTNRDIINMPFRPEKGGYHLEISFNVVIPVEANNSKGFELKYTLPSQVFNITDNIYTLSDTYSSEKIDTYFKELKSTKYSAAHFWENSALGNIMPIQVISMTRIIPRQLTTIIDAKLREKKKKEDEEKKEKEKEDKELDDDFWRGGKEKKEKEEEDDDFWRGGEKKKESKQEGDDFWRGGEKKKENKQEGDDFWRGIETKSDKPDFWSGRGTDEEEIELQKSIAYASGNQYIGEEIVRTKYIKISYFDHGTVDGDRVSIYLNNKIAASNIYLNGYSESINLELEEGLNKVAFEALNQGSRGDNTATFEIFDQNGTSLYRNEWNLSSGYKGTLLLIKK